jgi:hypothetical protein
MKTASASVTPSAKVRREAEPAGADILGDQLLQAGLEDRHLARQKRGDLPLVLVDANDLMSEIGKTGSGDEADIARSDHRHTHFELPLARCLDCSRWLLAAR